MPNVNVEFEKQKQEAMRMMYEDEARKHIGKTGKPRNRAKNGDLLKTILVIAVIIAAIIVLKIIF